MSDGINPPPFVEQDPVKQGWYSSIFRFIERRTKTAVVTTDYIVPANISWVRANATGGAIAVTYPLSLTWEGREIGVIKTDSSGNAVTVTAMGSDLFNGAATQSLATQYERLVAKADGISAWDVMVKQ